jgi:hypothetical protein
MNRRLLALIAVLVTTWFLGPADAEARRKKPRTGTLVLRSMTDGASVQIDGREVGTTPIADPIVLPAGKHTLKMTKRGHTEYIDVFNIAQGKATELDLDLLPFAGVLIVTSTVAGARVFVDGKFEGVTPLEKEVLVGPKQIRVTKAGYYDFIATYKSIAGKTKRLSARLAQLPLGSDPYRPKPLPPRKWYEKWYVWAGVAGGAVAIALSIALPVTLRKDPLEEFRGSADKSIFVPK